MGRKGVRSILVTGSSGLIGSEVCTYFAGQGFAVHGIDNNQRAVFFGPLGDTRWNQQRLQATLPQFRHRDCDIRDRPGILELVRTLRPTAIIHTAAQPSHDRAAAIPFEDFDTNAVGTLNLLEAARRYCPESPFVHMSTNKVYGDRPKPSAHGAADALGLCRSGVCGRHSGDVLDRCTRRIRSSARRRSRPTSWSGVRTVFRHADLCLRGGCLTGPNHSGVQLHGFLSYLVRCNLEGKRVHGLRLQGQAGARQHPRLRRRAVHPRVHHGATPG